VTAPSFTPFRGRPEPVIGDRIRVYRNLNQPGMYSIRALTGQNKGKVLGYAPAVGLTNVTFRVSERGRQTVLAKRERHVHAFAEGDYASTASTIPEHLRATTQNIVTYRPYQSGHFFRLAEPDTPVTHLPTAWAWGSGLIEDNRSD